MYMFIKESETKYRVEMQDFKIGYVTYNDGKWIMKAGEFNATRSSRKKAVEAVLLSVLKKQLSVISSN